MRTENVNFLSKGIKLSGVITLPDSVGDQQAGVLLLSGWRGDKNSNRSVRLAEMLANAGIMSLRFDFLGHGESEGDIAKVTVSRELQNVWDARLFLMQNWNADTKRMGIVGASVGGSVAILALAENVFRVGVVVSCRSDFRKNIKPGIYSFDKKEDGVVVGRVINRVMMRDGRRHNFYAAASKIQCQVMAIHGTADTTVPPIQTVNLVSSNQGIIQNYWIEGGNHTMRDRTEEVAEAAGTFLVKHLL
jgi:pimeloyl-ACP methyl ester carboxylesterase